MRPRLPCALAAAWLGMMFAGGCAVAAPLSAVQVPTGQERPAEPPPAAPAQAAAAHRATFVAVETLDLARVLPRWPEDDSLAGRADLEAVHDLQRLRTPEHEAEALADASRGPMAWAREVLGPGFDAGRLPRTTALLVAVHDDMRAVNRAANAVHGWHERPVVRDPTLRPSLPAGAPPTPAWPSARTAGTRVWAGVLCDLMPAQCPRLQDAAARSGWLRAVGGVHYPTDITAGRIVADAFLGHLRAVPAYAAALGPAREELAAAGLIAARNGGG